MKAVFNVEILLPVAVVVLQAFVVLFACVFALRKLRVLSQPLSGLEYSKAIFAAGVIFSFLLISTASATAMFQTFKVYQNQNEGLLQMFLAKSGQFFFIVLFFELLLALTILLFTKSFLSIGNGFKDILEGSIPSALITSLVVLGFGIVLRAMASEAMEYITPQYVNFR